MSILKNSENLQKILKIIGFCLVKIYKFYKKIKTGNEILSPKIKTESLLTLFLNSNLLY